MAKPKTIVKAVKGCEFLYSAKRVYNVSGRQADKVCKMMNSIGYDNLDPEKEVFVVFDRLDEYVPVEKVFTVRVYRDRTIFNQIY